MTMKCLGLILGLMAPFALGKGKVYELAHMNAEEPGQVYTLGGVDGQVYVVEAYFYNCPWCHRNAPNVHQLAEEYGEAGAVTVVDVGRDSQSSYYKRWIRDTNPSHPVLRSGRGDGNDLLAILGVTGYPATFVLDCNMNVVAQTVGLWDGAAMGTLRGAIERSLERGCVVE